MKMFLFISLMAVAATATMARPDGATLEVSSNTYYGMTYKDFRVFYQGVNERASYIPQDTCQPVTIKIFKEGDCATPIHTYTVPGGRKAMPGIFYFSLQKATPGRYQVQVCHGNTCSYRSTSLDEIPYFKEKLECYRVTYDKESGKESRADDFSLEILPITKGFREKISELTHAKTLNLTDGQNPIYKEGVLYTVFDYKIGHYKPLFDTADDKTAKITRADKNKPYTDEYCSRKYGLMVSVQLVNPKTNEIEYRFKETQYLTQAQIDTYLKGDGKNAQSLGGEAEKEDQDKNEIWIPIQVVIKDEQIKSGTYTLMVAVCPTAKDILDFKVPCADSLKKDNFEIPKPKPAAAAAPAAPAQGSSLS